jgi:hypothetical protein
MGDITYDVAHETTVLEPTGIKPRRNWLMLLHFLPPLAAHSNLLKLKNIYNIVGV